MDILSPVSDEEREDGEIVDDDLEDISDYSIPSCGKSDYSDGIIREISLSSISGSEGGGGGEREYCERKVLLSTTFAIGEHGGGVRAAGARKRRSRDYFAEARSHSGGKKHKQQQLREAPKHRRRRKSLSRSASLSSASDSSGDGAHVMDRRTLRQLNKAVRIETHTSCGEPDVQHRSLKDRLKRMIQPDGYHLDDPAADIKNSTNSGFDESFDKELEELRLQALKSAMLQKHMERKKRKAIENNQNLDKIDNTIESNTDKENKSIPNGVIVHDKATSIEKINIEGDIPIEDDLDIMRAMLLASMSQKITTEQPSLNPIQHKTALTLSTSSSPIPPEFNDKKKLHKPTANFSLPPVKPLIIRVNHDSESDTSIEDDAEPPPKTASLKIESSIEEFLRNQRRQFEANLAENENTSPTSEDLDKSFLKLLPKSQQQEYKLLKQKLLQAKKTAKASARKTDGNVPKKTENPPEKLRRDKRSQPKGKYKELAPIVQKIRAECAAQRRQEAHEKQLMAALAAARAQIDLHRRRHATLVGQYRKARGIIDLRWQTLEKAGAQLKSTSASTNSVKSTQVSTKNATNLQNPTTTTRNTLQCVVAKPSAIIDEPVTIPPSSIHFEAEVQSGVIPTEDNDVQMPPDVEKPTTEIALTYVSPLDKRETHVGSNPLQMLCPYELFGVCKDASCTFNHCP